MHIPIISNIFNPVFLDILTNKILPNMSETFPLITGRHSSGKYMVTHSVDESVICEWIESATYKTFEKNNYRLDTYGRPRNHLYEVTIPNNNHLFVMKMSFINPAYKLSRRLDLFINSLYKDYNRIAFHNMCALIKHDIAIAEPVAFWTDRRSWFDRRSYLLYKKINSQLTVAEFFQQLQPSIDEETKKVIDAIYQKIIHTLKTMHQLNFRYGDPHLNNILLSFADEKNKEPVISFIDYDHCRKTRIRLAIIKQFFDIRDISAVVLNSDIHSLADCLKLYFGNVTKWQIAVAKFWNSGGFNLRKHIGLAKKNKRHIRKTP